jgi:hypothetical protein
MNSFDRAARDRSLRRLEISSRCREESLRIKVFRHYERDSVKARQSSLHNIEGQEMRDSILSRQKRWQQKLLSSPLSVDLVQEEDARRLRVARVNQATKRYQSELHEVNRRVHDTALEMSLAEDPQEIWDLRREKRELIQQFRQLRAMRDVERTNSRIHEIHSTKSVPWTAA